MAGEKRKCPMCSTKLKMINGRMTCKSCGYYYRSPNEQTSYDRTPYGSQNHASSGQAQYGSQSRVGSGQAPYGSQNHAGSGQAQYGSQGRAGSGQAQYGSQGRAGSGQAQYGSQGRAGSGQAQYGSQGHAGSGQTQYKPPIPPMYGSGQPAQNPSSKTKQFWAVLGGTIVSVVVSVVVYFIAYNGVDATINYIRNLFFTSDSPSAYPDIPPASSYYVPSQESQTLSDDDAAQGRKPESGFFQAFAAAVWGKDYQIISPEEYAQLTALEINRDEKEIYYQLNYGETMVLTYDSDMGRKLSDLSCFTGLEYFAIDDDLSQGDLDGLQNLCAVYAENSIQDYLKILPNPENIQTLSAEDSIFSSSLDGIEAFSNLEYLFVEYGALEDISALTQLPNLLGLSLTGCSRLTDFSPLMSLTQLQELSIESAQLKAIDFISVMPHLTCLSVCNSLITDLNALAHCPEISTLELTGNYRIEDFTGLETLTGLVSLTLEMNYSLQMPAFQNLDGLDFLSLKYANDLSVLRNAPNVTYLCLEDCAGWELEAITAMQELTTLEIHGFHSATESLAPLTKLPKLEALDLTDTDIFGSINEVFGIPTLYYLNLTDCRIALDFDTLPSNETLQCLILDKAAISDARGDDYNGWNTQTVKLSDHYDLFSHFPNLTDLYLEGMGIDSIAFLESLPKLQYLDITDNNVTSLKPLESLPDFQTVWCAGNTILEPLSKDSNINVITSRD